MDLMQYSQANPVYKSMISTVNPSTDVSVVQLQTDIMESPMLWCWPKHTYFMTTNPLNYFLTTAIWNYYHQTNNLQTHKWSM